MKRLGRRDAAKLILSGGYRVDTNLHMQRTESVSILHCQNETINAPAQMSIDPHLLANSCCC